jgi:hypothetical protein
MRSKSRGYSIETPVDRRNAYLQHGGATTGAQAVGQLPPIRIRTRCRRPSLASDRQPARSRSAARAASFIATGAIPFYLVACDFVLVDCARYLWDADDLWVLATSAATAAATGIVVGLAAFERKPIERLLRR